MNDTLNAWPHKSNIVINPAKKRELTIISLAVLAFLLMGYCLKPVGQYFIQKHERDLLLPQMSALAKQGKPDAVIWMLRHGSSGDLADQIPVIQQAAEKGHPESMFLYGRVLQLKNDAAGAKFFFERAAGEGYPEAILQLSE